MQMFLPSGSSKRLKDRLSKYFTNHYLAIDKISLDAIRNLKLKFSPHVNMPFEFRMTFSESFCDFLADYFLMQKFISLKSHFHFLKTLKNIEIIQFYSLSKFLLMSE